MDKLSTASRKATKPVRKTKRVPAKHRTKFHSVVQAMVDGDSKRERRATRMLLELWYGPSPAPHAGGRKRYPFKLPVLRRLYELIDGGQEDESDLINKILLELETRKLLRNANKAGLSRQSLKRNYIPHVLKRVGKKKLRRRRRRKAPFASKRIGSKNA